MKDIVGLIGRDDLVNKVVKEVTKGRHVILTGSVGCGKSAVLEAVIERLERRQDERVKVDAESDELPGETEREDARRLYSEQRAQRRFTLVHIVDHQAKGQFIALARRLLQVGIVPPPALDLPERFHGLAPAEIEWSKVKRHVTRLSIRDLTAAIIPALHEHDGRVLVAVDDLTAVTPTLVAFWLAVLDKAHVIGCASEKRANLRKLWWKMTEIEVPPLSPEHARTIVQTYIQQRGMLIESPGLYIEHVVKQANGNPQAIADMLDDSSKEKLVDKRKIREMKHAAGVRYLDFTPVMLLAVAAVIGARYLAIGLGDTALYILAGLMAAVFLVLRPFIFRGMGKAS